MDEQIQKLIQGAMKAVKAGKPELARKAFLQVLKLDKQNVNAWLGLASVASDKKEQLQALKQALTLEPDNVPARTAVQKMGIDPERLIGRTAASKMLGEVETVEESEHFTADDAYEQETYEQDEDSFAVADTYEEPEFFTADDAYEEETYEQETYEQDEDSFAVDDTYEEPGFLAVDDAYEQETYEQDEDSFAVADTYEEPEFLAVDDAYEEEIYQQETYEQDEDSFAVDDTYEEPDFLAVDDAYEQEIYEQETYEQDEDSFAVDDTYEEPGFLAVDDAYEEEIYEQETYEQDEDSFAVDDAHEEALPLTPAFSTSDLPDYLQDMDFVLDLDDVPVPTPDITLEEEPEEDSFSALLKKDNLFGEDEDEAEPEEDIFASILAPSEPSSVVADYAQQESAPAISYGTPDLEILFARIPVTLRGDSGVPVPDATSLKNASERADAEVKDYLQNLYTGDDFQWVEKKRGRAGEREYAILRAQVGAVIAVLVLGIGAVIANVFVQQAEQRRLALAPTWTVSPTATLTPTNTPGVTPTPSITPALSSTPSPTLDPSVTPGSLFATPNATAIYVPVGVARESDIESAASLIDEGRLDEALPLLERARLGTSATGNFLPYYYLSLWHLQREDAVSAREIVETGEREWQERSPNTNYAPLVNVAYARVIAQEVRTLQANNATNTAIQERLNAMEARARAAIDADGRFIDARLLLAERYLLAGNTDETLRVLTEAKNVQGAFSDVRIRLATARLYLAREEYDRALQEANELLVISPYNEPALRLQVDVALAREEAGLVVIFAEQYLARYPESVQAFLLRGKGWALEGKYDLALSQYDLALQGEETTDALRSEILLARAEAYRTLRQYENALTDLTEAHLLEPDNLAIRLNRMEVAYLAGRYTVARTDADFFSSVENLPDDIISAGELGLFQARIDIDLADDNDTDVYEQAITRLNEAVNVRGIPAELRPIASEYLARAYYALDDFENARTAIQSAITAESTGSRYYLRGRILEALGTRDEQVTLLRQALVDYEYVLGWSAIYNYPFREELRLAHENLREQLAVDEDEGESES